MFTYLSANLSQSLGQLEATMLSAFSRAAKLKQWIARPDCPAFLKECKRYFDKAFSATLEDSNHVADSAFCPVPAELRATIPAGPKVAVHARHLHDSIVFSRSRTHIGNSLIMYYPNGNRQDPPIPAEIENIVVGMDQRYTYVVRRQLPAPPGTIDPFAPSPTFTFLRRCFPRRSLVRSRPFLPNGSCPTMLDGNWIKTKSWFLTSPR